MRIHEDPVEFRKIGASHLITSSAWRNDSQAAQGGVGMLLVTEARRGKEKKMWKRTMLAEFDNNPNQSVIVTYSPPNRPFRLVHFVFPIQIM